MNIDGIQRLVKSGIVERERTDEKGAAGECHDADPVTLQLPGHVIDRELCSRQAVRFDISSQHTARRVDREDDLVAAPADLLPMKPERRTREGREKADDRG